MRGKYILIEGGDGSGKGTQMNLLSKNFDSKNILHITTHEPGGTIVAEDIRKILLNKDYNFTNQTELYLYLAARSEVTKEIVKPALEEGKWVISDRGLPSTIAYQGFGLGIPFELISTLNQYAITHNESIIQPDLIYIINVPPAMGLEKASNVGEPDRQELRGTEFHEKVNQGYLECLNIFKDTSKEIPYLDGNPEAMNKLITQDLESRFKI